MSLRMKFKNLPVEHMQLSEFLVMPIDMHNHTHKRTFDHEIGEKK